MKPKSPHWADQTAVRIVGQRGNKEVYVVASGITPSGTVHIGNFREVITVDFVARALRDLGKEVRFIYSWDDFDTFRKVPVNLPQQEMLATHLRKPIVHVPDAHGKEESYARSNEVAFERQLEAVGIEPEYLYQAQKYAQGEYAEQIRKALIERSKIMEILNQHRGEPLPDSWLPTAIYCESCLRDEMNSEAFDGDWGYSYECKSCGHTGQVDIREAKTLKLGWRVDWPMRWAFEQVDFEPGGKDHSSQGGSFDTGKEIIRSLWEQPAPIYLQYDFVAIKGMDGKMSSSKGVLITLAEALEVYSPQMIRWIFASQRANHDFSIAFDEDVIKTYDEFDRAEKAALGPAPEKLGKWPMIRRVYELSTVDGKLPMKEPFRPGFRVLCNRLQVCDGDIERTLERFYKAEVSDSSDRKAFVERSQCALRWLEAYAPEEFCYQIHRESIEIDLDAKQQQALGALRSLIENTPLEQTEASDLNQKIYDDVIRAVDIDAKTFFPIVYQKLIGRDRGPRLPAFLKEIGEERLLRLL